MSPCTTRRGCPDETCARVRQTGRRAVPITGDLSDSSEPARLVADALGAFGRLDILVSHAHVPPGGDRPATTTPPGMSSSRGGCRARSACAAPSADTSSTRSGPGASSTSPRRATGARAPATPPRTAASRTSRGRSRASGRRTGSRVNAIAPGYVRLGDARAPRRTHAGGTARGTPFPITAGASRTTWPAPRSFSRRPPRAT